jgi:acyl-homoserine lactone acylase PvdQ
VARVLTILIVLVLVVLGLGGSLVYLAYGTGPSFEGETQVAGLQAPVTIAYTDTDVPFIDAQNETDLATGLGYAHALRSAWPMALWRQVAAGSLSMWFEDSTATLLDRHALTLGFGTFARNTFDTLPDDEQALLEAYAHGVNRAFERNQLNEGDEFVLFDVRAEPWRPWDALTVERLIAYLAASPAADSAAQAAMRTHAPLRRFAAADSILRNTLYIGGLEHSLAFTLRDSTGSMFGQRHVAGRSALPLFRGAVLRQDGRSTLAATVPGTLMLPAGYGPRAWSILLAGSIDVSPSADSTAPDPTFARIVTKSGRESLVRIRRRGSTLLLYDPDATAPAPTITLDADTGRADTLAPPPIRIWEVTWQGFDTGTDLAAWQALLRGEDPTFALVPGAGLIADGEQARVLGSPAVVRDLPGGTFVGDHPRSEHVAERLALWATDSVGADPSDLLIDTYSTWAADLAPPLIAVLGGPGEVDEGLSEASAYLRGWNFRYMPGSIAASIFDVWMAVHQRKTGALPDPAIVSAPPPPDTTGVTPELPAVTELKASLRQALALLKAEHGPIGADWRWQNVHGAVRYYPLFSQDASALDQHRFAPIGHPDGGHPTALAWGPSPVFPGPEATATWAALGRAPDWSPVYIRNRDVYGVRYRTRRLLDAIEPFSVQRTATPEVSLRLVPATN